MAQRYQREIEEILGEVNDEGAHEAGSKRTARSRAESRPRPGDRVRMSPSVRFQFSPGWLLTAGVALLIGALLLTMFGVSFAAPVAWLGVGLFVLAYVLFFARPRRTVDRRWRGQSIEDEPPPGGLGRVWRWITRG